jgi:hypothetical protein
MSYRLLFKEIRGNFNQTELDELCFELGYDPGEVFSQPGNLSRMAQDIQEFARRRGQEQELMQAIHEARPHLDLAPYEFAGGASSSKPASTTTPTGTTTTATAVAPEQQKVYISYAWGGASEEFVNQLDEAFKQKGLNIVRDKRELGYKGSIVNFMQEIGRAGAIIVVINEKYLKSPNCMFELTEIAANQDFKDRVFPVVLSDADIYNPVSRIKYVQHWEQQITDLDAAMKTVSSANLQGFREEIDSYQTIRNTISELTFILKDMNTLTPDMHRDGDFEVIYETVQEKIGA